MLKRESIFAEVIAELTPLQGFAVQIYRPLDEGVPWKLAITREDKMSVLSWRAGVAIINGSPDVDVSHKSCRRMAEIMAEQLGSPLPPRKIDTPPAYTSEEEAVRTRLLPLARLVGGNVYGRVEESADIHYAARMVDGLHDEELYIQGALDGLMVATLEDYWALVEHSHDRWDGDANQHIRVMGPTPLERLENPPSE